jgi:GT2 family glycosyltransferase
MKRPVIAVIPHYNMTASLRRLLPQLTGQGYDAIYVLDDHSRENPAAVLKKFPGVRLIRGTKNVGAGPNRQRILQVAAEWPDAIIHFIDADISLESRHIPDTLRHIFEDRTIGIAGGLVYEATGLQSPYNFGPRISFTWIGALIPQVLAEQRALRAKRNHMGHPPKGRKEWPNIALKAQPQDAHYVLEGNMAIPMDVLRRIGGFHPTLRFNEAQDLGNKIAAAGLRCRFDPSFAVLHHAVDIQGQRQKLLGVGTSLYMLHKNGYKWR